MTTIGYPTIAGNALAVTNNLVDLVGSYTASTGDIVTQLNLYAHIPSGSDTIDLALYVIDNTPLPTTRVSAAVTITVNSATPQWWSVPVSIPLTAGTTYNIAFGNHTGTTINIYRDVPPFGINNSQQTNAALPSSWSQTQSSASRVSIYATVSPGAVLGAQPPGPTLYKTSNLISY